MTELLSILVSDPSFVILDKPTGLSVHKGWDRDPDNAMRRLKRQLGCWVWPVHRIDRATSGCLAMALDEDAARSLSVAFAEHRVEKTYLAIVRGKPEDTFVVDHPLPRSDEDEERVPALTTFRRIASSLEGRYSLLEALPATGRVHQIRRHLRHERHPLCGDTTWGDNKMNKVVRERGLLRMALHAWKLVVPHPRTGERVEAMAPLPADLRAALLGLGFPLSELSEVLT